MRSVQSQVMYRIYGGGGSRTVSVHECCAHYGRLEVATTCERDIASLTDVVDVNGNGCVSTDAVLLHQPDELCLTEVVRS